MPRDTIERKRRVAIVPETFSADELEEVRVLDQQLEGGLTNASRAVLSSMTDVAYTAKSAAVAINRVLPWDMRRGLATVQEGSLARVFRNNDNIDYVSRFIASVDAVAALSTTALDMMGTDFSEKEPLMAAVAAGKLLADSGDDSLLGRVTRRKEDKFRQLELLGIPPGFYEVTRVPAIRATLEYAQVLAGIWVRVYDSAAKHYNAYINLHDIAQAMIAIKDQCEGNRPDLVATRKEGEDQIKDLLPRIQRLGERLLGEHERLPDEKFLRMSATYSERVDRLDLAVLQRDKAALDLSIDMMREFEAVQAVLQAHESGHDLLAQVIEEYRLLTVCEVGVITTLQSVARLLIAASTGVRKMQRMVITGETGYSLETDPMFLERVLKINEILSTYQRMVKESARLLAHPEDLKGDAQDAEKRMRQIVGEHRRDKRDRRG